MGGVKEGGPAPEHVRGGGDWEKIVVKNNQRRDTAHNQNRGKDQNKPLRKMDKEKSQQERLGEERKILLEDVSELTIKGNLQRRNLSPCRHQNRPP